MSEFTRLRIRAELLHSSYRNDVDLWAAFFVSRCYADPQQPCASVLFHASEHTTSGDLNVAPDTPAGAALFMWVYTERPVRNSQSVDFHETDDDASVVQRVQWGVARVGYAEIKVDSKETTVIARHLSGEAAATLRVTVTGLSAATARGKCLEWLMPSEIPDFYLLPPQQKERRRLSTNVRNITPTGTDTTRLPCGVVPMWSFFWAPTQSRDYDPESKTFSALAVGNTEALLLRLVDYGCLLNGLSRSQLVKARPQQLAEVCAAALAALPRAALFCPDSYVEADSKEAIEFDQWTLFDNVPAPDRAIYDCEDGTGLVLELMHALRVCPFRNSALLHLQHFARQYYAFAAIGTMKTSGTRVVNHCYPLILSKRYVDHMLSATESKLDVTAERDKLPPFTIESTVYAAGCWGAAVGDEEAMERFRRSRSADGDGNEAQRIIKARVSVPASFIAEQNVYEYTYALFCPELTNRRSDETPVKLELVFQGGSAAPTRAIMAYDIAVTAVPTNCSAALRKAVLQAYDHMPLWRLPRPPAAGTEIKAQPKGPASIERFYRGYDWDQFGDLRAAVLAQDGVGVCDITLAAGVRVVRVVRV